MRGRVALVLLGLVVGIARAPLMRSSHAEDLRVGPAAVQLRGVHFNPLVDPGQPDFPWLLHYPRHRPAIREFLRELVATARVNHVNVIVLMPHTLKQPPRGPQPGEALEAWANVPALEHLAAFVDDCHDAGLSVGFDLACNLWTPRSIDPEHQVALLGHWPMPDETPWDEAATWYVGVIRAVEARARHPEAIAYWGMMGNAALGGAEPCLWDRPDNPAITASAGRFVKEVWPAFRAAGSRPKAAPILLPIFADRPAWNGQRPEVRLSAFVNLKRWLIDDLDQPPDYWPITMYPFCDPAPDGVFYVREIARILGPAAMARVIATDLKGPGHDDLRGSILTTEGQSGPAILDWHVRKVAEQGWAGWWIWAYQDTPTARSGLRDVHGRWKPDLLPCLQRQVRVGPPAPDSGR